MYIYIYTNTYDYVCYPMGASRDTYKTHACRAVRGVQEDQGGPRLPHFLFSGVVLDLLVCFGFAGRVGGAIFANLILKEETAYPASP